MRDWVAWHRDYDDPSSVISARLEVVARYLADAIALAPPGPVSLISLCAGQGHDVRKVLPGHRRKADVRAVLVEADGRNAQIARELAAEAGLSQVAVRQADASLVANFADALPADVLLLCGILGNVSDADIERLVTAAPALCAPSATVIWSRHRRPPDLTPRIRAWFARSGFAEVAFEPLDNDQLTSVGVHRLRDRPATAATAVSGPLFAFRSVLPRLYYRGDAAALPRSWQVKGPAGTPTRSKIRQIARQEGLRVGCLAWRAPTRADIADDFPLADDSSPHLRTLVRDLGECTRRPSAVHQLVIRPLAAHGAAGWRR